MTILPPHRVPFYLRVVPVYTSSKFLRSLSQPNTVPRESVRELRSSYVVIDIVQHVETERRDKDVMTAPAVRERRSTPIYY